MKNHPNIEKHPLHSGVYIGYDSNGYAWRIQKSNSTYGNWCAISAHHQNKHIFAFRLSDMSKKLTDFIEKPIQAI
jgi:hypothetical protein